MSNLIPTNVQLPAHLASRISQKSALAASLAGGLGGGESFPRISIKGSRFRIKDGDTETVLPSTHIDVIVVGANPRLSKAYYAKAWDPNAEASAPDCSSLDGIKPIDDSENPQNDLCATCKWNQFGSKITPMGTETKACADKKRLAVVAADDPSGPIYLLEVTPAALKSLKVYQKELSMRGFTPEIVRTRLAFDTDASFPKLVFGFGGFIDEDAAEALDGVFGSDKVKEITGEATAAAAAPVAIEKPKPAPVKAEPVEEAKPIRGFGVAKAKEPEEAPAPKGRPKAAPKAEPVAAVADIADEIASLLGEIDADDA